MVKVPVHIIEGLHDSLVPPSNGRYLGDRLPDSQLTILDTGHFPWELDPGQYGAIIAETVARAETVRLRIPPPSADRKAWYQQCNQPWRRPPTRGEQFI